MSSADDLEIRLRHLEEQFSGCQSELGELKKQVHRMARDMSRLHGSTANDIGVLRKDMADNISGLSAWVSLLARHTVQQAVNVEYFRLCYNLNAEKLRSLGNAERQAEVQAAQSFIDRQFSYFGGVLEGAEKPYEVLTKWQNTVGGYMKEHVFESE